MIYDVHTHVGADLAFLMRGWIPYAEMSQGLLAHMKRNHIDRAVCFPMVLASAFDPYAFADEQALRLLPGRFPYDRENAVLVDEVQRMDAEHQLLPFAMFDPGREVPAQVEALQKLKGRIKGLKTQTTVPQIPILHLLDVGADLMHFASENDLPVVFHTALDPGDAWAQVADCLKVAEHYPGVRFNLAHSLRFDRPCLEQARDLPNVWVDCSAHLAHCDLAMGEFDSVAPPSRRVEADYGNPPAVLEAIHDLMGGSYMWGSDNPAHTWCDDTIRLVHSYDTEAKVLWSLPEKVRQDMAEAAPRAWLGAQAD